MVSVIDNQQVAVLATSLGTALVSHSETQPLGEEQQATIELTKEQIRKLKKREANKKYYENHKEKVKAIVKRWDENNLEYISEIRRRNTREYYKNKKQSIN